GVHFTMHWPNWEIPSRTAPAKSFWRSATPPPSRSRRRPPKPPSARGRDPRDSRPRTLSPMRYIEPHGHMVSRTTDDYMDMVTAGCPLVWPMKSWVGVDSPRGDGFYD